MTIVGWDTDNANDLTSYNATQLQDMLINQRTAAEVAWQIDKADPVWCDPSDATITTPSITSILKRDSFAARLVKWQLTSDIY